MQRILILGAALLAIGAYVATDAGSVAASGHEFISSKTGKTKSKYMNAQVFKTSAGAMECEEVTGSGEIKEGKSTTHKEVFTYKDCYAFGGAVRISPADFEFNANGSVVLENTVTIEPTNGECKIKLEPQTVEVINYENKSGKVEADSVASNIHSKGTGGNCGSTNTEGTYDGKVLGEVEGGTIEWK
jgi:hypothetical protein